MLTLMPRSLATASLSVKEAARVLDRSETWVRDHLATGLLERDYSRTDRTQITAASLAWAAQAKPTRKRHVLRLIVDNTIAR